MATVTHTFVSAITDDNTPTGAVGPDEWNAGHTIVGAALNKVDDTNVTLALTGSPTTALLDGVTLTLGWTGTLAAARLNANVVQSIVNDTNVTGSIAAQALTLAWTGTLSVARGGIGVGTLLDKGVLYGQGTSAVLALALNATATNKFLTQVSSGVPAWNALVAGDLPANGANPSASLGLAAVNGSATTWMRSDGAPALDQAITPTWTGVHLASASYRNSTYARIGSTVAPSNTTAGDLTVKRIFTDEATPTAVIGELFGSSYGSGVFGSAFFGNTYTSDGRVPLAGSAEVAISFAWAPNGGGFKTVGWDSVGAWHPSANDAGDHRGADVLLFHDSGAFNLTGSIVNQYNEFTKSVAGTLTLWRGYHAKYGITAGTITTAVAYDIERSLSGSGAVTTSIGIRIGAHTGAPTTDIAIQSLGGEHRFVGNVIIGANSAPGRALDVTGAGSFTTYGRIGSTTTPTNTTAGDLTLERINVSNVAFGTQTLIAVGATQQSIRALSEVGGTTAVTGAALAVDTTFTGDVGNYGILAFPTFTGGFAGFQYGFLGIGRYKPASGKTIAGGLGLYARTDYPANVGGGTVTDGYGAYIGSPATGASASLPTTQKGIQVDNQGVSGMTTALGVHVAAQSGATNNYDMSFGTVDATALGAYIGRIPVLYNGVKRYMPVYA